MIEIVVKGRFLATCYSCKTQFKYDEEDTYQHQDTDYTGSTDIFKAVRCPVDASVLHHYNSQSVT